MTAKTPVLPTKVAATATKPATPTTSSVSAETKSETKPEVKESKAKPFYPLGAGSDPVPPQTDE